MEGKKAFFQYKYQVKITCSVNEQKISKGTDKGPNTQILGK